MNPSCILDHRLAVFGLLLSACGGNGGFSGTSPRVASQPSQNAVPSTESMASGGSGSTSGGATKIDSSVAVVTDQATSASAAAVPAVAYRSCTYDWWVTVIQTEDCREARCFGVRHEGNASFNFPLPADARALRVVLKHVAADDDEPRLVLNNHEIYNNSGDRNNAADGFSTNVDVSAFIVRGDNGLSGSVVNGNSGGNVVLKAEFSSTFEAPSCP